MSSKESWQLFWGFVPLVITVWLSYKNFKGKKKFDQKSAFLREFPNVSNDYEIWLKRHLGATKY